MKRQYAKCKKALAEEIHSNLIKQQIWIQKLQNSKVCNTRPTGISNDESQPSCLGKICMKSTGAKNISHFGLSKTQMLLLWYQQTASSFPMPPLQRVNHSNPNPKGPLFC